MPIGAARPCRSPGCRALVRGDVGYCKTHHQARHAAIDADRGHSAARGYGRAWRELVRPAALGREPLCRFCKEVGRVVVATEVDHIDGNSRNNEPSNLRGLCHRCHSSRTAKDQAFGRRLGSLAATRAPAVTTVGYQAPEHRRGAVEKSGR